MKCDHAGCDLDSAPIDSKFCLYHHEHEDAPAGNPPQFHVKYYDAKLSKQGSGVQVRSFTDHNEAEQFAAKNKLYARPCKVEVKSIDQTS